MWVSKLRISARTETSSAEVASSSSRTLGSRIRARAMPATAECRQCRYEVQSVLLRQEGVLTGMAGERQQTLPADGVADHSARPSIQDGRQVDEADHSHL